MAIIPSVLADRNRKIVLRANTPILDSPFPMCDERIEYKGGWRAMIGFFRAPMVNLYSRDLSRSARFYSEIGFRETFRTPDSGDPIHVELTLDGFTLGIATIEAAREHHNLKVEGEGRWIEIVLWTDDTDSALKELVAKGAPVLTPAHDFLEGKLRAAWIADPDGNPIQIVQRRR